MTPFALAARLGVPFSPTTRSPVPVAWDGSTLHGYAPSGRLRGPAALWHDLAHWLLCPASLRVHAGFGLGATARYPADALTWGPEVPHDTDEAQAVMLQRRIGDASGYGRVPTAVLAGPAVERAWAALGAVGCRR